MNDTWRRLSTDELESLRDDIDDELERRAITDDRIRQAIGDTYGEDPS